jgi:23S rRNA (uracil1939-C5)-methyltransferase
MGSRKATGDEFEVTIDKLVYGGEGLGRSKGVVVFVPFCVPGDRLLVTPVERKKNFIRASIVQVLEPGAGRQPPRCPYFGSCGGCQWQQLDYARQVETKRQILEEVFHHCIPETRKLLISMRASSLDYRYRSRARFRITDRGVTERLGFYRYHSHDVEDIQFCPLLRPSLNEGLGLLRAARRHGIREPVRRIDLACSEETQAWASAVTTAEDEDDFPVAKVNPKTGLLRRIVGEYAYMVSPSAFFQANDFLVGDLVGMVAKLAQRQGRTAALDLFSGVGLFSLPLARQFDRVVAVESSPLAADLCARNATAARVDNLRTVTADVARWMTSIGSVSAPGFDVIVLDPPRTGAGPDVIKRIRDWAPETVIYVSCDPQTLVRDVAPLVSRDYQIDFIEGLDFFPQTYHFETVLRLVRQ